VALRRAAYAESQEFRAALERFRGDQMKKIAMALGTLTLTLAQAGDKAPRMETRSRVQKEVVLFVGDCRLNTNSTTDMDGNHVVTTGYSLDYHVCQEIVKYQVSVDGNGWNAKETPVAGSEQAPNYVQRTETKSFAGSTTKSTASAADVVDDITRNMSAANLCGQQKSVLLQQSSLDRQSQTYKNCSQ
jgi:hypothetical protein